MKRSSGGYSLIEVVISIVVLGLITAPICTSLVMSARTNAKAEDVLYARLAVSSAVERLAAEGFDGTDLETEDVTVTGTAVTQDGQILYYTVTVHSNILPSVSVTTNIAPQAPVPAEPGEGGL